MLRLILSFLIYLNESNPNRFLKEKIQKEIYQALINGANNLQKPAYLNLLSCILQYVNDGNNNNYNNNNHYNNNDNSNNNY